jgi:cellulose synthase/poly-beta-1,6-N-acetylglucosamine synthase-like glycosyltransferase
MQWLLLSLLVPYVYFILKISGALSKIKPYRSHINPETFVSVIVACRDEEKNLPLLLSDISLQSYSQDLFELIIIDDNSSDSTFKIASDRNSIKNLKVLKNNGQGKKKAIRTGIEASSGSLVITTDADCRMGNNWVKVITSFQTENKSEMVICPVKPESGRGFFRSFQELEFLSLQGITAGTAAAGNPVMCNGANLAFPKEIYYKHAANLHEELVSGDDIFLLHSIKGEPLNKILWLESEEASVTTLVPGTFNSFLHQRARWISKAAFYRDHYTQLLAIVTFVTICLMVFLFAAGFANPLFFAIFLAALLIKTCPDYMILNNATRRYDRKNLMKWILPSQFIYPFYVIMIVLFSVRYRSNWSH